MDGVEAAKSGVAKELSTAVVEGLNVNHLNRDDSETSSHTTDKSDGKSSTTNINETVTGSSHFPSFSLSLFPSLSLSFPHLHSLFDRYNCLWLPFSNATGLRCFTSPVPISIEKPLHIPLQ